MKESNADLTVQIDMMDQLSKGIDPTTGIAFAEDTVLANPKLQVLFEKTKLSLCALQKTQRQNEKRKKEFHLSAKQAKTVPIEDEITVSHLAHNINGVSISKDMKKLKATLITQWLEDNGFLQTMMNKEGDCWRIATKKGRDLGIKNVVKQNAKGRTYSANLYSPRAQKYIISFLDDIVLSQTNGKTEKEL